MRELKTENIYLTDCIRGLRLMPESSADIIVTSPPYNIGKKYSLHDDHMPREDYLAWMALFAEESRRVLKEDGSFFLNIGGKPSDGWLPFEVISEFRPYYSLQNTIQWIKSIAIEKTGMGRYSAITEDIAVGHYQPVNSRRYLSGCHEPIFHLTKKGDTLLDKAAVGVPYQDKTNIGRWKRSASDLRDRGNVWFIPYSTIRRSRSHPATFPVRLPEMCIKLHGRTDNTVVLDPFMGSGSTAIAALNQGVHYIGFEIDPNYKNYAEERIREWHLAHG